MGDPLRISQGSVGVQYDPRLQYPQYAQYPQYQQQQQQPAVNPFSSSTFTPAPNAQQQLLQVTGGTDSKTGLPKSGTVRADQNGMLNLPGVGAIDLNNLASNPNVKVKKGGNELEVKIPGTKYKYKLKKNADGSWSFKLKKPGFWSKLKGFLMKALQFIQPFLSMIPGIGPILSGVLGAVQGAASGDIMGAVSSATSGIAGTFPQAAPAMDRVTSALNYPQMIR